MTTPPPDNTHADLPHWLALLHAPGVGPITCGKLLARFGSPRSLFETRDIARAAADLLSRPALDYLQAPDWDAVEVALKWRLETGNHILTRHDDAYPALLREMPDAPPVLFITGDPAVLSRPQLAMVGSRNPSSMGRETAHAFAASLAQAGLVITSGLALGIDAASHQGALDGGGWTVAVAGTGLDRVYPAKHRELAHRIATRGALVSEFPPGTPPKPEHFPRRNRIIAGLARGTLVVEAALSSGSLITARFAVEQNREVFAIPGSIHNPLSRGCHRLIRDGAKLVETAQDVLEELGFVGLEAVPEGAGVAQAAGPDIDINSMKLLDFVGYEPTTVDTLVARSGLTAEQVCSMLLVLELHNVVVSTVGNGYVRSGARV